MSELEINDRPSDGRDESPRSKRAKLNRHDYRQRSPPTSTTRSESSYRPRPNHTDRREYDSYRPRGNARNDRQRSASPNRVGPKNKKSMKDRKENPSSRIHSLRRQLSRGGLPGIVHQEKERELAALLFEQQKANLGNGLKKNIQRYHFIRFLERKKASKNLKQLKKQQRGGDTSELLDRQIHEAQVDLNYTLYAPLAQKYISLFAGKDAESGRRLDGPMNMSKMNKRDYAILSEEQKAELDEASAEAANALEMNNPAGTEKPPMWYQVERRMEEGQDALDRLRDDQSTGTGRQPELVVGMGQKKRQKPTPDWLTDDGMIDPKDLDSEHDEDEDEEMSDGDGGFFEKR